jgi:23S rRNA pseudouridine1911/1915/1917 synthase
LERLDALPVSDGRQGCDALFLTVPFTKAALPAPVFGEGVTPAYRAAFDMMLGREDAGDDFWMMRGEPGVFAVAARRLGGVWRVGGVTAAAQTLTVRFEDLWLRMAPELRALRYTVAILRDPATGESGDRVEESFDGQAPDVRVALDLAKGGGFLLTFTPDNLAPLDEPDHLDNLEDNPEKSLSFTVPPGVSERLDAWLAAQAPDVSRSRIQALIKQGRVTSGGAAVKANAKPAAGQVIEIQLPAPVPALPQPEDIPLDIVYEDDDLLVLDKPAGLVVHPAPGHAAGTLVNALLHHCTDLGGIGGVERPGIVHRLDKDTSGLMVVAKNDAAMAGLVRLFQTGGISKEYLALVHGAPSKPAGTVIGLIGRHPVERKRMAVVRVNGKQAVTHYTVERRLGGDTSLLRCRIETGRTHQIRVHAQSLGCPLVGDALYGRPASDSRLPLAPARQMLHAARLAFAHPVTGAALAFTAPPPEDFAQMLAALAAAGEEGGHA